MKKAITNTFKIIGFIVGGIILIFLLLLLLLTVTEYKPKEIQNIEIKNPVSSEKQISKNSEISILSWNIGYAALNENADCFLDGGKQVISCTKKTVLKNLEGINQTILSQNPDLIFLQETDVNSKRSHYVNEVKNVSSFFNDFEYTYADNFKVLFIPYPLPPLGKVRCGITTLSRFKTSSAERIKLPCPFAYPGRLGNLKRCLLINRIPVTGSDKELVLVNLHLEAYDSGEGKIQQTKKLVSILQQEMAKGNYVIAAGDFNQTFSNLESNFPLVQEDNWMPGFINAADFGEDFTVLADSSIPSCRLLNRPYVYADDSDIPEQPVEIQFYVIDGMIVSSNITVNSFKTLDQNFKYSDHNPVLMNFVLN